MDDKYCMRKVISGNEHGLVLPVRQASVYVPAICSLKAFGTHIDPVDINWPYI